VKRIWLIATVFLAALAFVTGGTDAVDINRMVFVVGLGIDAAEEDYSYTFYTAVPTGSDNAVSENNVTYESVTIQGRSMAEAVRKFERDSSRDISLEHLNCCAVGRSAEQENLTELLDYLLRDPSVRKQCALLLLDCPAEEFFGMEYSGSIASGAAALLEQQNDSGRRNSIMTIGKLSGTVSDREGYCLYILGVSGENKQASPSDVSVPAQMNISGLAVYNQQGFSGRIDSGQAELARLFQPRQASGVITTVDDNGNDFHYEITYSDCRKSFTPGQPLVGRFDITVECVLIDAGGGNADPPDEETLSHSLREQLSHILDSSRELGPALVGIDREARQSHRKWYSDNAGRFDSLYRSARLEMNVKCQIEQRSE